MDYCCTVIVAVVKPSVLLVIVCPYGDKYAPNSDEIEPGNVKEVEVDFVKIEEGDSQEWVARVNWTRPKGKMRLCLSRM